MHYSFKYIGFIVALVCLTLNSCITYEKINYMQEPGQYGIPNYTDTLDFEEYRVRIDDRLYVRVYSTDEKTESLLNGGLGVDQQRSFMGNAEQEGRELYTYLVHEDSTIYFPTLGKVKVHGLTTREIKYKIEDELTGVVKQHEGFRNISVDVSIVGRYFSIIGPQQSGRYQISKEKLNIFEALAVASDISDLSDKHKIQIIRQIEGKTKVKTFDIRSKDIINSEFYYIEPNDVIYIRNVRGYSFGLTSAPAVLSLTASTISFGVFIYAFVNNYIVKPLNTRSEE
ncbi:MAG: polysaccharide biosynthesis/export family protein [Paludibacteraceae bacterium]|nr:polysaccharide biosynthesis/export family protein [Paludibacteraceae bacterium]